VTATFLFETAHGRSGMVTSVDGAGATVLAVVDFLPFAFFPLALTEVGSTSFVTFFFFCAFGGGGVSSSSGSGSGGSWPWGYCRP